ncbi:MAG: YraN family protein [Planctomycetaceae bacterium]
MLRRERGRRGERAAERLLRREGLTILARNWRAAGGELDLVALDGETIVFLEVKSREAGFDGPWPAVSYAQRRRIGSAARAFRERYGIAGRTFRFDTLRITGDPEAPGAVAWDRSGSAQPAGTENR